MPQDRLFHTQDPFKQRGFLQHFTDTVFWRSWVTCLVFTLWAILAVLLNKFIDGLTMDVEPTLITVMGTVLGFCISYRTTSAYQRYWEGRVMWSDVTAASRTFTRIVWLHVPNQLRAPTPEEPTISDEDVKQILVEKKSVINLTLGFAVALKHYLRGEHSVYYEDLYRLVCWLPKYKFASSNKSMYRADLYHRERRTQEKRQMSGSTGLRKEHTLSSPTIPLSPKTTPAAAVPLLPAQNSPPGNIIQDYIPFLTLFRSLYKFLTRKVDEIQERPARRKARITPKDSGENLPLDIVIFISSYVSRLQQRKIMDVPTTNALLLNLQSFGESLTSLERVLTTPIPVAYSLHLRHVAWLYLFALPFQLYEGFGYVTIAAEFVLAFIFIGFLEIGQEIENPLGYDANDLDMDTFVKNLAQELHQITSHSQSPPEDIIFSHLNHPLPDDSRSAEDLRKMDRAPLEALLAQTSSELTRSKIHEQ